MRTDTRCSCNFLSGNRTFSSNYIMNICQAPELFCVRQASILSKHHWHLESRCLFFVFTNDLAVSGMALQGAVSRNPRNLFGPEK